MWLYLAIAAVVAYLLGNLNGAVVVSHMLHDDVRSHGSGNAGLTNFIRTYGASRAPLVILIDAGKAVAGCLIGGLLLKSHIGYTAGAAIGGAGVILGHVFPAFLGFRGGKGILSSLFVAICVDWRIALIILAVFAGIYFLTQYVSLGSVLASLAFGVSFALLHRNNPVVMGCGIFIAVLAIFMHRKNIQRLIKGEERRTNLFKKKGA